MITQFNLILIIFLYNLKVLPISTHRLNNGLQIILIPHKVGSVTSCLRGLAGSNFESPQQVGASHALEHLLTFKSQNFKREGHLRNIILQSGGRITGTTSRDDVAYLVKTLKKDYQKALLFLSEIFYHPYLEESDLDKTKKIISHEIQQNIENPQKHLARISYRLLYPGQRFSKLNTGNIDDLDKLNLETLKVFRKKFYQPQNFVLSVCGDLNEKEFFSSAEKLFSSGKNEKKKVSKPRHHPNKLFGYQIETRPRLSQLYLKIDYFGYSTSEKEKYPAFLLARYFAYKLKQLMQSSYSTAGVAPYTLDVASFSSHSYGLFSLYTVIKPEDLRKYFYLYNTAINEVSEKKIVSQDLKYLKNKLQADFEFTFEKTSLRADFYSELYLYDQLTKSHNEELKNYLAVRNTEISQVAREIFSQKPKVTILDQNLTKEKFIKSFNDGWVEV
jgi:predicted Zn-dependent peptidase